MGKIRDEMIADMKLHGLSLKTITIYTQCVREYAKYYNKSPLDTNPEEIKDFFHYLITKGRSPATIHLSYASLKYLFKMYDKYNLLKALPVIKRPFRIPAVLSVEEVQLLLNQFKTIRNKLFFSIVYSAGLRLSEAINLHVNDIDISRNVIYVRSGKGNKDRVTILSRKAKALFEAYISKTQATNFLFFSKNNPNGRLNHRWFQTIFKNALRESKILKDAHIHTLRHSFATHLLENNVSIFYIMKLLGHASISSTMVYLHMQNIDSLNIESPLDSNNLRLINNIDNNQLGLIMHKAS